MSPRIKTPEILPVMVGTAGHVDHGKTSLVRLLTGCETDRLPEEKARGMSIDLGFAPCLLPGNRMVGIIDVPGHLDFIRNMVAGAASMDILMLVIAADDGIMPQTEEHLRIIRLLRAPRLLIALTKTDLVDAETLALAQEDVAEFAARAGYPDTPVVPVSNLTGEGVPAVRKALDELVQGLLGRVPDGRAFRMAVERVFAVPGHGTVVTGIPASGRIAVGDEVLVLPGRVSARVRSIQNYHHLAETTGPNVCAALNLANLATEDVHRGMCITSPVGEYRSTHFALAQVANEDPHQMLRHNAELRLHCGTASSPARVSFLDGVDLPPGGTGFAKLRLAEPLVLAAGDRFILRRPSPSTTLGGGVILSAIPQRARSHDKALAPRLADAAEAVAAKDLPRAELMARPSPVLLRKDFPGVFRREDAAADAEIRRLVAASVLGELADGGSCVVLPRLDELAAQVRVRLRRHHREHPGTWGPDAAEIAAWFGIKTGEFAKFAEWATGPGSGIRPRHGRLALADFAPAIPDARQALREKLEAHLAAAGIAGPAIGDIVTAFSLDKKDLQPLIRILVEERKIVTVGNHLLSADVFQRCTESVRAFFAEHPVLGIGEFRERTGAARNFAVALLEKLDAIGLTRRTPDGRVPGPRLENRKPE
jgi:selenocysteine-specific elongation factor